MENMYFLSNTIALGYLKRYGSKIYGNMYKLPDGRLIKKYNKEKIKGLSVNFSEDDILNFKDIDIDGVSFIKALIYTGIRKIYATITEDVPGVSINKMSLGTYPVDDLIEAIRKLEITIRELSDRGISATMDIHTGNIVFDGNRLSLIDTAEYYYSNKDILTIYEDNMLQIMNEIFFNIFTVTSYIDIYYLKKYFDLRNSRYAEFNKMEFLLNPSESLTEMRRIMEEDFGVKINTFNESSLFIANAVENENHKRRMLQPVGR